MPSSYGLLLYLNVLPIKLVLAENYSMQQESELEIESFYDILPSPMATQKCFLNAYLERVITIRKKTLQLCFTLVQADWCLQHTVRLLMWPNLTAMKKHYRWVAHGRHGWAHSSGYGSPVSGFWIHGSWSVDYFLAMASQDFYLGMLLGLTWEEMGLIKIFRDLLSFPMILLGQTPSNEPQSHRWSLFRIYSHRGYYRLSVW